MVSVYNMLFHSSRLGGSIETNDNLRSKLKNNAITQGVYEITLVTKRGHM